MKHRSSQAVFDYWDRRRGSRPAPERGDIDPTEIRHALGDTFMLAADFVDVLRFRLAGTRVCALFCRELKGEAFAEIFADASRKGIEELIAVIEDEQVAAVAGLIARTAEGHTAEVEMLLLPLAHSGHARIRALGVLAPTVPPYWLGATPVAGTRTNDAPPYRCGAKGAQRPPFRPCGTNEPSASRLRRLQRRTGKSAGRTNRLNDALTIAA